MSDDQLAPGIYICRSEIGGGVTIVAETGETICLPMTLQQMRELASKLQSEAAKIGKGMPPAEIIGEVHA